MRRGLTDCSGLAAAGLLLAVPFAAAKSAEAAEPVKLTVGGFFRAAYMVVADDDEEGDLGFDRNTDGLFNDAEIHFTGSTVLDNGLEVGARVELEGETDDDQIDEAWVWFSGGFGEIRIGSDDEALANACITPPGGTANFSAFSPNQWGANTSRDNTVCTGVDASSDAQKILYISPLFYGFQLTASYTPAELAEDHNSGAGPHLGMPEKGLTVPDYGTSVYLTYTYEGEDWGLTWGGGASLESGSDTLKEGAFSFATNDQDYYQTGLTLRLGDFAIGGAFEYQNDIANITLKSGGARIDVEQNVWAAGGGIAYAFDAWTLGAQYSYRNEKTNQEFIAPAGVIEQVQQRVVATASYALGPGIDLDAALGYTWVDVDTSLDLPSEATDPDGYDAFEIGIGTSIKF